MLLVVGAALGLIAGLVSGGSFQNLLARRLRWPMVVIAAFLVKELELRSPLGASTAGPAAFALSLAVLIGWAVWHRDQLPGIWLVAIGMAMNLVVTLANAGHMPVSASVAYLGPPQLREQGAWAEYALMGPGTRLGWLGDWVVPPGPIGRLFPQAYSPGDLVSLAGLTAVMFLATRAPRVIESRKAITTRLRRDSEPRV